MTGDAPAFPSVATQSLTPDPLLATLSRQAPVARIRAPYGGACWLVMRYDDVRAVQTDAANRDESVFADPERFDATRVPNPHVAFGHGAHFCIGAQLARMELQVAVGTVAPRFPGARLAVPPDEVPWRTGSAVWASNASPCVSRTGSSPGRDRSRP